MSSVGVDTTSHHRVMPLLEARISRRGYTANIIAILLPAVIGAVAAGLASSAQTPIYQASAVIVLRADAANTSGWTTSVATAEVSDRELSTAVDVLQNSDAVQKAAEAANPNIGSVSASQSARSSAVTVTGSGRTGKVAADTANAYANAFVVVRKDQRISEAKQATGAVQADLDRVQSQTDSLATGQSSLKDQLDSESGNLTDHLSLLNTQAALADGGADVLNVAIAPRSPTTPNTPRNSALGAVLGGLVGAGAVLMMQNRKRNGTADALVTQ